MDLSSHTLLHLDHISQQGCDEHPCDRAKLEQNASTTSRLAPLIKGRTKVIQGHPMHHKSPIFALLVYSKVA